MTEMAGEPKGKAPAFQFYPSDWMRDLSEHSLEIEGAWIRICCVLFYSETRGTSDKTLTKWARILRVGEKKSLSIIAYLDNHNIADVVNQNGSIRITSRRMVKDENLRYIRKMAGLKGGNPMLLSAERKAALYQQEVLKQKRWPSSSSSSSSSLESKNKSIGKSKKHFSPPSVLEVNDYCVQRNNKIDPQVFVDSYEAKGWMIGKNKMKDWKAAVRTWEARDGLAKQGGGGEGRREPKSFHQRDVDEAARVKQATNARFGFPQRSTGLDSKPDEGKTDSGRALPGVAEIIDISKGKTAGVK